MDSWKYGKAVNKSCCTVTDGNKINGIDLTSTDIYVPRSVSYSHPSWNSIFSNKPRLIFLHFLENKDHFCLVADYLMNLHGVQKNVNTMICVE